MSGQTSSSGGPSQLHSRYNSYIPQLHLGPSEDAIPEESEQSRSQAVDGSTPDHTPRLHKQPPPPPPMPPEVPHPKKETFLTVPGTKDEPISPPPRDAPRPFTTSPRQPSMRSAHHLPTPQSRLGHYHSEYIAGYNRHTMSSKNETPKSHARQLPPHQPTTLRSTAPTQTNAIAALQRKRTTTTLQLILALLFVTIWVIVSSAIFQYTEDWSFYQSFYFCYITLTTIGYGDVVPKRSVTSSFFLWFVIIGLGAVIYLLSLISEILTQRFEERILKRQQFRARKRRRKEIEQEMKQEEVVFAPPEALMERAEEFNTYTTALIEKAKTSMAQVKANTGLFDVAELQRYQLAFSALIKAEDRRRNAFEQAWLKSMRRAHDNQAKAVTAATGGKQHQPLEINSPFSGSDCEYDWSRGAGPQSQLEYADIHNDISPGGHQRAPSRSLLHRRPSLSPAPPFLQPAPPHSGDHPSLQPKNQKNDQDQSTSAAEAQSKRLSLVQEGVVGEENDDSAPQTVSPPIQYHHEFESPYELAVGASHHHNDHPPHSHRLMMYYSNAVNPPTYPRSHHIQRNHEHHSESDVSTSDEDEGDNPENLVDEAPQPDSTENLATGAGAIGASGAVDYESDSSNEDDESPFEMDERMQCEEELGDQMMENPSELEEAHVDAHGNENTTPNDAFAHDELMVSDDSENTLVVEHDHMPNSPHAV